jgi:hypothetical protein
MARDWIDRGGDDEDGLPEHELREEGTVGGGLMSSGGEATDRGTGEMTSTGMLEDGDDDVFDEDDEDGPKGDIAINIHRQL